VEAIDAVLTRLPAGEDIAWLPEPRVIDIPPGDVYFSLPDAAMMDAVKEHAAQYGLNLRIL
jgi:hypothetical protein